MTGKEKFYDLSKQQPDKKRAHRRQIYHASHRRCMFQVDMEIQILELRKLPKELKNDSDILNWMRFLGGKTRREFEAMAKKDEYIEEAYRELEKLSADEQAKLEYEAREKAIRDHNSQMNSALKRGMQRGMEKGIEEGMKKGKRSLIRTMLANGAAPDLIAKLTGLSLSEIKEAEKLPDSAS
nr:Rpn family recombination-promoting nuclease/putative transposase [Mediterraneibacter glycyrrhizinilyticus]